MSYIAFLGQLRHDFADFKLFFFGAGHPTPLPTPGVGFPFRHPLSGTWAWGPKPKQQPE